MYSGDMRREASIVSRSGPLVEVTVKGAVASDVAVAWVGSKVNAIESAVEGRDVGSRGKLDMLGSRVCLIYC